MQIVQLYVEGERVDMFQDESITISDSIANVKDISKIYTTYSRQFTLPASKTNNRIFKHYYNFDITENTFDARFRVCLLYTSPSPRDRTRSRMPSSA